MKLRLIWRPSRKAPAGLAQARARLRQSADAWAAEDRAAVGEFLQAQIARAQAENATGSWLEVLTTALDYRAWHEFGIERHQHGAWVPATGPASGGERVRPSPYPCSPPPPPTTPPPLRTPRAWSPWTKPSPVSTTTPAPSAWACCTPSTWTW